jgi:N-methylhydantoinase B
MARAVDPITFEVIKNGLSSVADEMALIIMRSAYSPVVRDSMDYSTALCDRHGQIIAQGLTLAVQLGAFPDGMRYILRDEAANARPGDIFIFNDPYGSGGQHLPDIYVIKPIFHEGRIEGYACTMAHHSDVGGIAPGSTAIHATDIHQEGLCIPLLKLYDAGQPNRSLFRIIEKNTRQPIQVLGDLKAQLAACATGERGYLDLLRRYGAEAMRPYLEELQDQAERMMRDFIRQIPDGAYEFVDYIDGVGDDPQTLRIQVKATVAGDEITIDLTGTSRQVAAAINCPIAMIHSAAYCAIRCITSPAIPNCEGYIRPIRVIAPEGTIVNPLPPAACAARGVMGYRVFDAIMGALAQVVPNRVIAAGEGGPTLFSIGGTQNGRQFVLTEVMVGTWGARAGKDGVEGISNPAANLSNQPVELIEAELPLEVVGYGLVPDSGGAGKFRGGLAFHREFRVLCDDATCTTRADRRDHRPYGLAGGEPGGGSQNIINPGPQQTALPTMPMRAIPLRHGDVFRHISAGGGGYGDPLERPPEAVLEDVRDEKVSLAAARERYGVVIDPKRLTVDREATAQRRQTMRKAAKPAPAQALQAAK